MATILNRTTTFPINGTVTAAGLHNLIDDTSIYAGLITTQTELTTVGTSDQILIAVGGVSDTGAPRRATVQNLFDDALTGGTYTNLSLTGALTYGTATGNRTVSTSATITTGTIPTLPLNNSSMRLRLRMNDYNSFVPTLTTGTTTSTAQIVTSGTTTNFNSTTGTIATLNSTTGTIGNLSTTLAGDFTISQGTATLATSGATAGTYGSVTAIPFITVDAKGRITSATTGTFSTTPADGSITFAKLSTSTTEADNVAKRTAKAWVNFNGTGTVAIRSDFNISSITDHDIGKYTVNFRSALSTNTYSIAGMCAAGDSPSNGYANIGLEFNSTYSTSAARITCLGYNVFIDPAIACVSIFGS